MKTTALLSGLALAALSTTSALAADPAPAAAAAAKAPKVTPELVEKGKVSFTTNCVVCHGEKGDGNGPAGAALNPKPRNFATEPLKQGASLEQLFGTLEKGVPGTPMVAFAHLSADERWALAAYVQTFIPKAAEAPKGKDAGKGKKK